MHKQIQPLRKPSCDSKDLYGQFLLVESAAAPTPAGWTSHALGGWTLAVHPMLPVLPVRRLGGDERAIGYLLGMAAGVIDGAPRDGEPRLVKGELRLDLPTDAAAAAVDDAIERQLYRLGGRFACVLLAGDVQRMYLDACGSLATVYATTGPKRIASTTTMLAYPDLTAYRATYEAAPRFEPNKFYPAGLTNDDGAMRLLPNHYLDLTTWAAVRHWPTGPIDRVADDAAGDVVARIASAVRNTIVAVGREHPLAMGLSAGRDSRMVLACARQVADRFTSVFSFFYKNDRTREVDVATARKLCRAVGLPFRQLALPTPPDEIRWDYLYRVGYCAHWGKANDFYEACRREIDLDSVLLTGFGGELGRLFYWHESGPAESEPLTGRECLERLKQEPSDRNLRAMERWAAGLPKGLDRIAIADLLYCEMRSGCWSSPQIYGTAPFRTSIAPFGHRDAIAGTMVLPAAFRKREALAHEMVNLMWPALSRWPFQQYTGLEALRRRVTGRMLNAIDKLRRLFKTPAPVRPAPAPAGGQYLLTPAERGERRPLRFSPSTTPAATVNRDGAAKARP